MNKFVGIGLGIVAAGSLAGNALMFQRYSSAKPVVSMGSDAVSIKDFRDRLEVVSGKQVLTKMVLRSIVMSEAKAKGVAPTKADVEARIELMKRANVNGIGRAHRIAIHGGNICGRLRQARQHRPRQHAPRRFGQGKGLGSGGRQRGQDARTRILHRQQAALFSHW